MRTSMLLFLLAIPLFNLPGYSEECPVLDRMGGTYSMSVMSSDTGFAGDEENTGAYMGVDISDITPERVSALKLKDERGVEVTMVDQDAPAGKAGLKEHDVILTMNGTNVESGAQLRRMIRETPAGRLVTLGVSREGQPVTIKVQLAARHKSSAWGAGAKDFKFDMPNMSAVPDFDVPVSVVVVHSSLRSGLMVENITPQLGDFFGVKSGQGVLVRSVEKGSRAEKSGFRAGDVIVRVNTQPVRDTSDFSHAIRSNTGGSVNVGIIRDKHEQKLTLPLPERKDSGDLFEETFELPEIDAEAQVKLDEVRNQMARIQPQMQFALRGAQRAIEQARPEMEKARRQVLEEVERQKPEIEKAVREAKAATERAQAELCSAQKALRQQTQKLQKDLQKQQRDLMHEHRKQLERLGHEMRGDCMDI
jgi:membrane-associated protease RseP (regulator of RpoE activity)